MDLSNLKKKIEAQRKQPNLNSLLSVTQSVKPLNLSHFSFLWRKNHTIRKPLQITKNLIKKTNIEILKKKDLLDLGSFDEFKNSCDLLFEISNILKFNGLIRIYISTYTPLCMSCCKVDFSVYDSFTLTLNILKQF
jgi:hypothetical protein